MSARPGSNLELEKVEIDLLLEGVRRWYGVDLADVPFETVRERAGEAVRREELGSLSALQERILHQPAVFKRFLRSLRARSEPVPPAALREFRTALVPLLRTYPFIRIWQAGCRSAFEPYILAIIMLEEGVYHKATIYSTDPDSRVLGRSRDGLFPMASMKAFQEVYAATGGRATFEHYCCRGGQMARFDVALRRNMVFAQHDFTQEGSFNEFNAIFCRRSIGALPSAVRENAVSTLSDSLVVLGFLMLGHGDSLKGSLAGERFILFNSEQNLYRKIC